MAVIVHVVLRGVTSEQYNAVRAEVGHLERAPSGGLVHLTWWEGSDCHIVDAWKSEDAFNTFVAERLGPAMGKLGIAVQPEITFHAAHEVYAPQAVTLT